jgi:5-methylcytosine-specific restriction endonuclease McrA
MAKQGSHRPRRGEGESNSLDNLVAKARANTDERLRGYRELSLKLHPWICGRCGREFTRENLHLLTVHHKDHNHDNNPLDGSNWENLCIYCHDNEHSRYLDHTAGGGLTDTDNAAGATKKPFANLKDLLKPKS